MAKRKAYKDFMYALFFLSGLSLGILSIWPGILKNENRKCFIKIIKDGSDGKVSIETVFSIEPQYLMKINNSRNTYSKVLYIGDYCFRK
mgnify:FL=1